jgi:hypothetical protein
MAPRKKPATQGYYFSVNLDSKHLVDKDEDIFET